MPTYEERLGAMSLDGLMLLAEHHLLLLAAIGEVVREKVATYHQHSVFNCVEAALGFLDTQKELERVAQREETTDAAQ